MTIEDINFSTSGAINPAAFAEEVTPSASPLTTRSRALYIGVTGDLVVTMAGSGNDVTFSNVPAGAVLPIRVTHVLGGTTAAGIVAIY